MTHAATEVVNLARMRWHCRRGMRELDVLLTRYFEQVYPQASVEQQQAFGALLDLQDPTILAYLTGKQTPERADIADVIEQLTHIGA
ncbi:MAG: succinate dehydrogenase assembly factor 2 [Steroidobacteraceae bacterium]